MPYIQKILSIKFSDVEKFPMSTKGRNILYFTMSLSVFPDASDTDDKRLKLEELKR